MRLELSRFIEGDLDDIASYIAQGNPRRAVTFLQDIRAKFRDIHRSSMIYRLRPDVGDEARMATVGNYAILFRVIGEVVRIERVTYSGRDLPPVFDPSWRGRQGRMPIGFIEGGRGRAPRLRNMGQFNNANADNELRGAGNDEWE